jgi:mannitol/fructose-specific phosphotransferase system IIA component (Ntr-type)
MKLTNHFTPDQILLNLEVEDKWELLDCMLERLLASPICQAQPEHVREKIGPAIVTREKETPTGIGNGFAYPHARIMGFEGYALCLATLKTPVEYESVDRKPVDLACMVVTSQEDPVVGVRVMGQLMGLLADEAVRDFFLTKTDPSRIYSYLQNKEVAPSDLIRAKDFMRPPLAMEVRLDTPLQSVVRTMLKHHVEAVAVTDDDGRILGEITCDLLFKKGVPDFFNQLPSVAFIKNFDPFEKYFAQEAHSVASDVMSTDFAAVGEDATLMEIIYLLAVRNYSKAHVVRDGRKVGSIDRILVLDRILNA